MPNHKKPLSIRLINTLGNQASRLGIEPSLCPAKLMAAAERETACSDYGDPVFMPAFKKAIDSLETEAKLNTIGRIMARHQLLTDLKNRLWITDYRKQHPEICERPIRRPLFILGLPRTGTTILYELLAQDPANRAPITWEILLPMPPPREEDFGSDPRIASLEKGMKNIDKLAPDFKAIHEIGAELPQECLSMMASSFVSEQYSAAYYMDDYRHWLREHNVSHAYEWHYKFLQHLQSGHMRERWLLKTPNHLQYLDYLLAQYPDACIVHTHRDPMDVMPSVASLAYTIRCAASDQMDPVKTGLTELEHWDWCLRRCMQVRDNMNNESERIFDVRFNDFMADHLGIIEKIYAHFDLELTTETRERMQAFLKSKPRAKHGTHRYTLEQFGLDADRDNYRFNDYRQRFGL